MLRYSGYLTFLLLVACAPSGKLTESFSGFFKKESIFSEHFTGFALYDPDQRKTIYDFNATHFFTPASNTKILTLYSALKTFSDSIPAAKYRITDDTIYVWPMGDPTTLHPAFGNQVKLFNFLNQFKQPKVFCKNHFKDERFGAGWAWDDFPYYYQTEKSWLPFFGNVINMEYHALNAEFIQYPNVLNIRPSYHGSLKFNRGEFSNDFEVSLPHKSSGNFVLQMPLHITDQLISEVLTYYLAANFKISDGCSSMTGTQILYSMPIDTVYTYMMQQSDNFIAEQLQLAVSGMLSDTLKSEITRRNMLSGNLKHLAHQLQWYDGSGLSRYNMFTPNAMVQILDEIRIIMPEKKISRIFAAGGATGTIASWYQGDNGQPFIYAKTGSLKAVHCLSGYIYADSGKLLIFSFMHNNFATGSTPVKEKMDQVLRFIKRHY